MFFGIGSLPLWLCGLPVLIGNHFKKKRERKARRWEYIEDIANKDVMKAEPLKLGGKIFYGLLFVGLFAIIICPFIMAFSWI